MFENLKPIIYSVGKFGNIMHIPNNILSSKRPAYKSNYLLQQGNSYKRLSIHWHTLQDDE